MAILKLYSSPSRQIPLLRMDVTFKCLSSNQSATTFSRPPTVGGLKYKLSANCCSVVVSPGFSFSNFPISCLFLLSNPVEAGRSSLVCSHPDSCIFWPSSSSSHIPVPCFRSIRPSPCSTSQSFSWLILVRTVFSDKPTLSAICWVVNVSPVIRHFSIWLLYNVFLFCFNRTPLTF